MFSNKSRKDFGIFMHSLTPLIGAPSTWTACSVLIFPNSPNSAEIHSKIEGRVMRLIASHAVIEHLSCQLNVKHLPFHIHIQLPVQLLSFQQDWRQKIRTATGARASPHRVRLSIARQRLPRSAANCSKADPTRKLSTDFFCFDSALRSVYGRCRRFA